MSEVVAQIAPYLKAGSTLSDVGSVKKAVIDAVEPLVPGNVHFVPAHPLAGTEHSGPESGFSTLLITDGVFWFQHLRVLHRQ